MKSCSLCGNNFPELISAIVEGSMLEICEDCSKFGNVIEVKQPEIQEERRRTIQIQEPEELELIIKDFPNKIKEARELMGLKQEEIAKKIAEKESVIQQLESGHLEPPLAIVRKLESLFHIRLMYNYKENRTKTLDLSDPSVTIGDLVKKKDD